MASRRRVVEEKNLKILRELAALPSNKQCFDCNQRGPTYINMTIGSFVCTSCSGILRGLTPPHRVKSITMTTFTPEEIEFLKSRGNEYCRCVWLGTYDSRTSNIDSEGKDEHRKRDLMVQKYEKKRWYVSPDIAVKSMQREQIQQKHSVSTNHLKQYNQVPEVRPISQLLGKTPAALIVENNSNNNQSTESWPHPVSSASAPHVMTTKTSLNQQPKSFDLLSEFATDAFKVTSSTQNVSAGNGNFANFESAFSTADDSANSKPSVMTMPASMSLDAYSTYTQQAAKENIFSPPVVVTTACTVTTSANVAQSFGDRYAALADLDSLFHQPSVSSPSWSVEPSIAATTSIAPFEFTTPVTSMSNVFTTAPSNPFTSSASWNQPLSQNLFSSANPFQSSAESCLPYQQSQVNRTFAPLPVVGNSPSDDTVRSHFNPVSNVSFALPNSTGISSPQNGFQSQPYVQNGEFLTSPTANTIWGIPAPTAPSGWPASHYTQNTLPSVNKHVAEAQFAGWNQSAVINPFTTGTVNTGTSSIRQTSPSNPFL